MLLDSRQTRIFHVEMAFLFPSNAIVKIKYYITKGSKKGRVFCAFLTYLITELQRKHMFYKS